MSWRCNSTTPRSKTKQTSSKKLPLLTVVWNQKTNQERKRNSTKDSLDTRMVQNSRMYLQIMPKVCSLSCIITSMVAHHGHGTTLTLSLPSCLTSWSIWREPLRNSLSSSDPHTDHTTSLPTFCQETA